MAALMAVTTTAMTQNQNPAQSSLSVEEASRDNNRWFAISLGVATLAALATGFVSLMVFRTGNRVQDAIRQESAMRVAEATATAAEANRRAAEAELELARLREWRRPRVLMESGRAAALAVLRQHDCRHLFAFVATDEEVYLLGTSLQKLFNEGGWMRSAATGVPSMKEGVEVFGGVDPTGAPLPCVRAALEALTLVGVEHRFTAGVAPQVTLSPSDADVAVFIGKKPME